MSIRERIDRGHPVLMAGTPKDAVRVSGRGVPDPGPG
jgi:hypothetical protein